jgi:5-methylthioribose kinase
MSLRSRFASQHPDFPLLSPDDPQGIEAFLRTRGWIASDEPIRSCGRAGDGNMNLTLRIETGRRSFVLKQARPWVEKYDEIAAPWDRALHELRFYEQVRTIPGVADRMPELLHADAEARALLFEDLVDARDLSTLYRGDRLDEPEIDALADYLRRLHRGTAAASAAPQHANREMRSLNHEHIFRVPLADDNGLDLETIEAGLAEAAASLRGDERYLALVADTSARYLRDGGCLLHGDYFPGSWLRTPRGVRVIDPEFAFPGDPEVDVGCALGHLALADQPIASARRLLGGYQADRDPKLDPLRVARYAAVETMRRLIGVAQLPLPAQRRGQAGFRATLLERSRQAMLGGDVEALFATAGEPE